MVTFGVVPSELDLSRRYGYWPVHQGWIQGERVYPGQPLPKTWTLEGPGLGQFGPTGEGTFSLVLQTVATLSVAAIAGLTIWGAMKGKRR